MEYTVREIRPGDDAAVERVIRSCLVEFGANHAGTAWADPDLGRFSQIYVTPGNRYFVAVDEAGAVAGGVGIGALPEAPGVCELQKMYCLPHIRGTAVTHRLMDAALAYAGEYYVQCYLETFSNMVAAQKFYEKYGFRRIDRRMADTGHYACDVLYLKDL